MATDWTTGKSGSFEVGTDLGTTSAWAVMRFDWEEQYSPSTGKHILTIIPNAKTSVSNLANAGETSSHYIIGTVTINGTTVFNEQYSNVATFFYSKNTFYPFTDATDGYKTEIWTSPEFSGTNISIAISLTLVPASSYWNSQSIRTTQTLTGTAISTSSFSGVTPYVYDGSNWVESEMYVYNSGWKVDTSYIRQ